MMTRLGLTQWFPQALDRFRTVTMTELIAGYLRDGRIRVDDTRFSVVGTYHDPCNWARNQEMRFGKANYDDPRYIMNRCLKQWVELYPNKQDAICCGGGGGSLSTPYDTERRYYSRGKIAQIKASGADWVITPCHGCHGQLNDIKSLYGMETLTVKYPWELVVDCRVL